jgi:hypothetical protein
MAAKSKGHKARERRVNARRNQPNSRQVAAVAAESECELQFFAAGDGSAPESAAVEADDECDVRPRLTPEQLAKRNGYRRRVTRLMIGLGMFAAWAVTVRLTEVF